MPLINRRKEPWPSVIIIVPTRGSLPGRGAVVVGLEFRTEHESLVRGSGGKNVIFSNGPNSTFECFNLL